MTKVNAIVFLAALTSAQCLAQYSEMYGRCFEKALTQHALHVCANEEAVRTDTQLNELYQKILAQSKGKSALLVKVRTLERIWITYRDAYIDAMYPADDKQLEYGTSFPTEVDLLRVRLTKQHIAILQVFAQATPWAY
jgi:uncharacterized protein YecT (DUF1311 family)